jgi:hypothetical protein|nr:MAG TPA: MqsA [Caudoviricetes sp.]
MNIREEEITIKQTAYICSLCGRTFIDGDNPRRSCSNHEIACKERQRTEEILEKFKEKHQPKYKQGDLVTYTIFGTDLLCEVQESYIILPSSEKPSYKYKLVPKVEDEDDNEYFKEALEADLEMFMPHKEVIKRIEELFEKFQKLGIEVDVQLSFYSKEFEVVYREPIKQEKKDV